MAKSLGQRVYIGGEMVRSAVATCLEDHHTPEEITKELEAIVAEIALLNGWWQRADGSWNGSHARRVDIRI